MQALLFIPWFRLEAWRIPLPFSLPMFGDELPIQPFGILVAIGVLLGANLAERFGAKNGIAPGVVSDMVFHVVATAFVCCYLLNGLLYETDRFMEVVRRPWLLFDFKNHYLGLSSYGGFIGAVLGLAVWKYRRKLPAIAVGDAAAFAFPLGWLFGRTGCFVVHDHPGAVTDFFLAVADYQVGEPPYEPRHDLGLYEVFWCLLIVPAFLWLSKKRRVPGFYMAMLPIAYAPIRFFLDYLRAGPEEGGDIRYGGFTPGQYGSVLLLLGGLALYWWIKTHEPTPIPAGARADNSPEAEEDAATREEPSSKRRRNPKKQKR